ncbi:MAG: hypothetical protein WBM99_08935, partial [Psychromonas sp.]
IFIISAIFILPKLWRLIKLMFRKIAQFLGLLEKDKQGDPQSGLNIDAQHRQLQTLRDQRVLSEDEFKAARKRLFDDNES